MEALELKATVRAQSGTGSAKRLRRKGLIPAVLYGPGAETLSLTVNASDLRKVRKGHEDNLFIKLLIDDAGKQAERTSLIKEIQIEPLTNSVFHADFYAIRMDHKITFDVPLHYVGQPAGIEKGGELQQLRREVRVSCLPSALPEFISLDIAGLDVGESILVKDLCLPEGILCVDAEDIALVTITALHAARPEASEQTEEASS
ncbi:MAG: 50S ribosomal protein L25 [Syntrophus sp. PtaU1.Bin005]|jgi:large subunit ribosomal protein L25|uniref:50S ribosomal protein L25/general stress protein Ctc n=1 Tax=Syntrophus sp. (in: bacteria) TaxID=48412 RepID=UPI0009D570E6|nr:MAG: 50S ribosomal protein L25 [Syntrophus sp. PtaB.Bin138]OPY78261.1 MAG: 50S ribosomal protein L25 [Syntrophus sp. PtaU1.Bin005]